MNFHVEVCLLIQQYFQVSLLFLSNHWFLFLLILENILYAWVLLAWLELCLIYHYLENYWHGGRSSQCQICTDETFENIYTSLGVWLNIQFYHIFHFHMCFSCGSACTFQKTCSDHIGGIYIQSVLDLTFSDRSVDGCACFFPEDFRNMDLVLQG